MSNQDYLEDRVVDKCGNKLPRAITRRVFLKLAGGVSIATGVLLLAPEITRANREKPYNGAQTPPKPELPPEQENFESILVNVDPEHLKIAFENVDATAGLLITRQAVRRYLESIKPYYPNFKEGPKALKFFKENYAKINEILRKKYGSEIVPNYTSDKGLGTILSGMQKGSYLGADIVYYPPEAYPNLKFDYMMWVSSYFGPLYAQHISYTDKFFPMNFTGEFDGISITQSGKAFLLIRDPLMGVPYAFPVNLNKFRVGFLDYTPDGLEHAWHGDVFNFGNFTKIQPDYFKQLIRKGAVVSVFPTTRGDLKPGSKQPHHNVAASMRVIRVNPKGPTGNALEAELGHQYLQLLIEK